MITYAFLQNQSASPLYKSLAYSLVSFFSGLWWVSLAEYLLILRALFSLLLQMVRCTMSIASTVCTRWWATTRTNGNGHSFHLIPCFCGLWLPAGTVSELRVCGFKTTCFRYVNLNLCYNNFFILNSDVFNSRCKLYDHVTMAAKSVQSWLECWLVGNLSWFHRISGCTGLTLVNYLLRWKIFLLNLV
jgi:hypothetical protein